MAEQLYSPVEEIVGTAVHEIAHLWAHSLDLRDCSASGRHNKVFKQYAEALGLVCAKPTDHRGFAYTGASPALLARIREELQPDVAKFALFRLGRGSRKSPTKMFKWTCGCTTVRCATYLEAACGRCGKGFAVVV